MARRLQKTLIDYLVMAISPALIMALIGSLVFFLIEVFYEGPFEARLKYVFTLYVFAAVLVGRIAIEEGREHARLFAVPLAAAALVVLLRFVESAGPLSLILVLVILWCADKLTWDCTVIDERQRDTGKGLLQVAGLDSPKQGRTASDAEEPAEEKLEGTTSRDARNATWWKRLAERQRRPHAPGVWIVYFSLAALPLFGIGQLFIPPGNLAARQSAFRWLLIYVASGLGLLLATSFLGLRRYLRQRRVGMPAAMAGMWLATGCALIVAVLILAALLPRPGAKYAVLRLWSAAGSRGQTPFSHAVGKDGVDAEKGALHRAQPDQEGQSAPPKDTAERGSEAGQQDQQDQQSQPASAQPGTQARPQSGQEEKPDQSQENPATGSSTQPRPNAKPDGESRQSAVSSGKTEGGSPNPKSQTPNPQSERPGESIRGLGREVGALFRWIFYLAVALIGLYWLWRSRAEVLAALQGLLQGWRGFWQKLLGGRHRRADEAAAAEDGPKQPLPRPFAAFADPFATGAASRYSPDELVRYSFQALEAWAREHGCPRRPEQTPHEFARDLGARVAPLSHDARSLVDLYCRVAYASGNLPAASVGPLKELWRQLRPGPPQEKGTPQR
jgi:hypothetical protein